MNNSQIAIHNTLKYLFIAQLAVFNTLPVNAKENYIDEIDLFEDVQTVTSATRLKQKITDAPVSVTIIDSDMIAASGATEIYELFRFVPGYFSYATGGNQFGVSSHFQPRDVGIRLEVQVNGRSIYDPLFTAVDWSSIGIDLTDIDYIEVVRGSSATAYGSNAFLGAINIITRDAISRPRATIRTTIGNNEKKNVTVNYSGNLNDVDYAFSLVSKNNSGFPKLANASSLRDFSKDDSNALNIRLQGSYVPNIENEIKFEVGIGENKFDIPTNDDSRGFSKRNHKTRYQKIQWIKKSGGKENSLQFYHNYLDLEDDLSAGLVSDLLNITPEQVTSIFPGQQDQSISFGPEAISERFDLEFEQKNHVVNNVDYVWGLGARKDLVTSRILIGDGERSENRYRIFGNVDWHINEKFNTNLGLLIERSDSIGTTHSPRLALNFHPAKHHTIRTSIIRGQRIPSVTLQNLNTGLRFADGTLIDTETTRSDNLSTEQLTAYEIAYMTNFPSIATKLDLKLFREEMDDFVYLQIQPSSDLDGKVRVWDNLLDLTTQGVELQLSHTFLGQPSIKARLAYAYMDTDGSVIRDTRDGQIIVASAVPKHSGTLLLTKELSNQFDLSTSFQYQSDYQNRNVAIKRLDLRLGKKLKFNNSKGKINFVVQNAFNEYNDFSKRNVMKTRGFINMEVDF